MPPELMNSPGPASRGGHRTMLPNRNSRVICSQQHIPTLHHIEHVPTPLPFSFVREREPLVGKGSATEIHGLPNAQLAFELRDFRRERGTDRLHCLRSPFGISLDDRAYLLDVLPGRIDFLGEPLQVGSLHAECRHDRFHERRGNLFWKVSHCRSLFAGVSVYVLPGVTKGLYVGTAQLISSARLELWAEVGDGMKG
jgi:hypothetical protein